MPKKISEITEKDVASYLRVEEEKELLFISQCLDSAKAYIKSYTGLVDLDSIPEFVHVVYVLCQDMYDVRSSYIDRNSNINKVVKSILDMHSRNYI